MSPGSFVIPLVSECYLFIASNMAARPGLRCSINSVVQELEVCIQWHLGPMRESKFSTITRFVQ